MITKHLAKNTLPDAAVSSISSKEKLIEGQKYVLEQLTTAPANEIQLVRNARSRSIFRGIPEAVRTLQSAGLIESSTGNYHLISASLPDGGSAQFTGSMHPFSTSLLEYLSIFQDVPDKLKAENRWVVWQSESRNDKPTKVPYQCHQKHLGSKASSNKPTTWSSFLEAISCYMLNVESGVMGIGFMLGNGFIGFDFDGVRDPDTSEMHPLATLWISMLCGYSEVSPSLRGVKTISRGKLPSTFLNGNKTGRKINGVPEKEMAVEAYQSERFFTMTGKMLSEQTSPTENQEGIERVCSEVLEMKELSAKTQRKVVVHNNLGASFLGSDAKILDKIRRSRQGDKFNRLWNGDISDYPSASEADLALASILMFWTGNNEQLAEHLFSQSALADRNKWQRDDYRQRTLSKAIQTHVYSPYSRSNNNIPNMLSVVIRDLASVGLSYTDIIDTDPRGWILIGLECPQHGECFAQVIVYRAGKRFWFCDTDGSKRSWQSLIGGVACQDHA